MSAFILSSASQQAQFWRSYQVSVECGEGQVKQWGNVGVGASNLRMAFTSKRVLAADLGGTVMLTNLNPVSRRAIVAVPNETDGTPQAGFHLGSRVTVRAGYNNNLSSLLVGHVRKCTSQRSGADIVTTLDLIGGAAFGNQCMFKRTYAASPAMKGGAHLLQILQDITDTMSLNYPGGTVSVAKGVQVGIKDTTFPRGISFDHTCQDALRILLKPQGLDFAIENGQLRILPRGSYDNQSVVVLGTDTGLINTPTSSFREGRNVVNFQALLNPLLVPGRLVTFATDATSASMSAGQLPGYYKIFESTHEGDSHGPNWSVSCEAERYELPIIK